MRNTRVLFFVVAPLVFTAACKPDLGDPPSIVDGPRLLAVRGVPAEAEPTKPVTYDVLAVDVTGRLTNPSVTWATCDKPKPPAEANAVSAACLTIDNDPPTPMPTFKTEMPPKACKQFGPLPPDVEANKPPLRPRDPDVTGGFYQPVRAILDGGTIAFALERIKCGLSNAPSDVTGEFNMTYTPNVNPTLESVALDPDGEPESLFIKDQGAGTHWVGAGGKFTLETTWSQGTPESYPVFDPTTGKLVTHREALSVAWFTTQGTFEHDRTGRGESETDLSTRNVWTAPMLPGPDPVVAHLWVVLRDSRGGVDFAGMDIEVRP